MTVKSQSSTIESSDLQALIQLAGKLIGETCWRVNFSYGDELMLHFGDRLSYRQASMSGQEKGAWILGTRISPWQVYAAGLMVANSETDSIDLIECIRVLIDRRVLAVEIDAATMQLSIGFTDGFSLTLLPELDLDPSLPDWELFMPDGMVVQAGRVWSLIAAD